MMDGMIYVALEFAYGKESHGIDGFMTVLLCRFRYATMTMRYPPRRCTPLHV